MKLLTRAAVETRRGWVAGAVPQKFWSNNVVTKALLIIPVSEVTPHPTIFASATGTEEATIPSDFVLYNSITREMVLRAMTNIGQTSNLTRTYNTPDNVREVFPQQFGIENGILISTNATSLSYQEISRVDDSAGNIRYFIKENDPGVQTYNLVR